MTEHPSPKSFLHPAASAGECGQFQPLAAATPPLTAPSPAGVASAGAGHPYSATCNCDECFAAWMATPPPSQEEQQRMARAFMAAVAPLSGGELVTDWPKVSFPDLDANDAYLAMLDKGQRRYVREMGK